MKSARPKDWFMFLKSSADQALLIKMDLKTVIFFGRSGSGKGTQAELLIEYLKKKDPARVVLYMETGGHFRKFMEDGNFTSRKVKEVLDKGELLPEFLPIWSWTQFFIDKVTGNEHIITDGLARQENEAPVLDSAVRFYQRPNPDVILIEVSRHWASQRLSERGRYDDTQKDIARRLDWFDAHTMKAVDYFKNQSSYNFHEINGEQTIEEVHKEILKKLKI